MFILFASLCFFTSSAPATTIHVPAEQPTIQAAIEAAHNGDTVIVAPGTYFENVNFLGKGIVVASEKGPNKTDTYSVGGVGFGSVCSGATGTTGNFSADPLFISNFNLQPGSPAINAGTNSAPDLPTTDIAGNPRIVNGIVDLGVFESQ